MPPVAVRRLMLDHLPRTAGSALAAALAPSFGDIALPATVPHQRLPLTDADELVSGTLSFVPGEQFRDGWAYATLVRDPIERAISQYRFNRLLASSPDGANDPFVLACGEWTLLELVRRSSALELRPLSNVQARHFAERVAPQPERLSDDDLFAAAVESLSAYDVVGRFDDLDGFVVACCEATGRPRRPALGPVDDCCEREHAVAEVRLLLKDVNAVDLRLVEWVEAQHGVVPKRHRWRRRVRRAGDVTAGGWTSGTRRRRA